MAVSLQKPLPFDPAMILVEIYLSIGLEMVQMTKALTLPNIAP